MAEGGQLPWKRQTIDESRGPAADYSKLRKALPKPPEGLEWQKSEDGDWKLVSVLPLPAKTGMEEEAQDSKESSSIEDRDYLFHTVLPSDTLAGLCLRYKISSTKLRQVNKFSGSNLLLAPARLLIPLNKNAIVDIHSIQVQDTNCPDYKLQTFLTEFPHLRQSERRAYLELNDWNLQDALRNAADDDAWERSTSKKVMAKDEHSLSRLHVKRGSPKINKRIMVVPAKFAEECPADGLLEPLLKDELELAQRFS